MKAKKITIDHRQTWLVANLNQAGLTLIELLTVTSIFVLLMATSSFLFINFMTSGTKVVINQKLKAEANKTMKNLEFVIRNAKEVTSQCQQNGANTDRLSIINQNETITSLQIYDDSGVDKVASIDTALNTRYLLTSNYANANLQFTCYQIPDRNAQYVNIELRLNKAKANLSNADTSYTTYGGVLIRNSSNN